MFEPTKAKARRITQDLRQVASRNRTLKQIYHWSAAKYREVPLEIAGLRSKLAGRDTQNTGVRPENIIWIFGSGRSGSTWLRSMMRDLDRHQVWEEPMVGRLFGEFHHRAPGSNLRRPDFIMANATRKGWIRSIRNFVLDGAKYARPRLGADDYLVVKEPNGSVGAQLLMEALPESRMVLLVRDPRDVVASWNDAHRKGGWQEGRREERNRPLVPVDVRAQKYLENVGEAKRAYDSHEGPKVLVRYEELRADTLGTMRRIYSELGILVDEGQLARAVEKHSWENIPEGEKGEGKFYRKAKPGGWREDLTPEQVEIVEEITAPLLKEFYPHRAPRVN